MSSLKHRLAAACIIPCLVLAPTVAAARSAGSLSDLVGARGSSGEQELESRGWVLTDGHKGNNTAYTYWWNPSRKDCVMVATRDGRYDAITDVTPADCNQRGGGNAGGAVAAGALAAILIAAAASHKSGHHDNGQHYADNQQEAEYERGYNDGMYNQAYHNYSRSDSYSSGYQNGVEQRGRDTGYRDDHRHGAGYAPSADVSDLVGARGAGAESDLLARGFRSVDGFASGSDGRGSVWYNSRTRQCLQMIVVNGRVDSLGDIGSHPRCR